ncbi:hypothetical protein BP1026B_II1146 [Burkholderia pseudomallei 1026b]|uniref:Uncharacterized protein n=1 Tax=Burkholderia pseudomallei (strain 1026b) TaxID=884204 RepID=A0A0H3HZ80_BURP2|nr:hypothetical protein BP1026B_II1146 [Burkholderia pseudomallei 1026b]AUG24221.1 hypothetical protein CXQ84_27710 [Burkholderia pseudomallei]RXS72757.1 hypothetical protein C2U63_30260 [Burkholderia pseudomallei]
MQAVRSPRFRYRGWHGRASAMRTEPGLHGEAATDDRQSITGNPQSAIDAPHASPQARKRASAPDSGNLRTIRRKTRRRDDAATRGGYAL